MSIAYSTQTTVEKKNKISELLSGYWGNDVWDCRDSFFDSLRSEKWNFPKKTIDFSGFRQSIRNEIKYMYAYQLKEEKIKLTTVFSYGVALKHFAEFLSKQYPHITSIAEIPHAKVLLQWRSFLIDRGIKINDKGELTSHYKAIFNQLYSFFVNLYDTRDEYEKDVWDCRNIPGAKITENKSQYLLDFSNVPLEFRELAKRYIKYRTTNNSQNQCTVDIVALRLFFNHIHSQEPTWKDLTMLTRKHMENYLAWYRGHTEGMVAMHIKCLVSLRKFLEYSQQAMFPEAPELPVVCLLFKEDIPKQPQRTDEDVKYISEGVLQQLEENLEHLSPSEYIPIVILLRASGWRISDILNLRYDTCLDRTSQGWYLCGDIPKTQVINHRVPITDEVYAVVKAVVEEVKVKSTPNNNPNHLLFVRYDGKRKGRCPDGAYIRKALNRLAKNHHIVDYQGNVFHFGNHAFRHTKAVELINNGMPILHVQKWLAHASPEMSLRYAKVLDTTMRKSWEEANQQGLFKIGENGVIKKIDVTDIQNEDVIEWEYIRQNLDAVRMPLGYCMKPKKLECQTQLNPCLTCRNLCTTPDFIPQYELEIQETKALIQRGKAQGQNIWVEKNQTLLDRYEEILGVLKTGKIHHKSGKKGRELVGEERVNA
ncbi:tyrosine-type recombinase/integrase [Paenibacillus sp. FSL W8-1187]|uniref:tyrosine-type recombinase/integrase n=1 Tax=Paenibacillus sp. FSL W8-1187 TaxID=2975339 RepID=UPI0030D95844